MTKTTPFTEVVFDEIILAGDEGFEPPNAGTRTQCLTTWRIPNNESYYNKLPPGFLPLYLSSATGARCV